MVWKGRYNLLLDKYTGDRKSEEILNGNWESVLEENIEDDIVKQTIYKDRNVLEKNPWDEVGDHGKVVKYHEGHQFERPWPGWANRASGVCHASAW